MPDTTIEHTREPVAKTLPLKQHVENAPLSHAPYNFVPLATQVVSPDWSHQISQDLPFRDGLSGCIDYEIEAFSPLLVGQQSSNKNEVHFFRTPDGELAIPGSSLRGMIRSVLEIATFSRMGRIDDRRYSVRDFDNASLYTNHLTEKAFEGYRARAQAGWLRFVDGRWRLRPCEYGRIAHDRLAEIDKGKDSAKDSIWWSMPEKTASDKYALWDKAFRLHCAVTPEQKQESGLVFRLATPGGKVPCDLVFTGQPSARTRGRKGTKCREFVFFNAKKEKEFEVPEDIINAFLKIHKTADRDKAALCVDKKEVRGRLTDFDQLLHVRDRWSVPDGIPVFFLNHDGNKSTCAKNLRAIGMAQAFRLMYKNSTRELLENSHKDHNNPAVIDLAEAIFGRIDETPDKSSFSLKSRVSFEMGRLAGQAHCAPTIRTILSSPKPTFYPNYIEQPGTRPANMLHGGVYKTYMDSNARLRGWKRYPARPHIGPTVTNPDNNDVHVVLSPLREGTRFRARMSFHNLKPVELGAVLWAMTWGNQSGRHMHSLGMGKSLGLGQVRLTLQENPRIVPNHSANTQIPDIRSCMTDFASYMDQKLGGYNCWAGHPSVQALLATSLPEAAKHQTLPSPLQHMRLARNEFKDTKGTKERDKPRTNFRILPAWADLYQNTQELLGFRRSNPLDDMSVVAVSINDIFEQVVNKGLENNIGDLGQALGRQTLTLFRDGLSPTLKDEEVSLAKDQVAKIVDKILGPQKKLKELIKFRRKRKKPFDDLEALQAFISDAAE